MSDMPTQAGLSGWVRQTGAMAMDYASFDMAPSQMASGVTQPDTATRIAEKAVRSAIPLVTGPDCTIILPAGATLDDIALRGRDLILEAGDGQPYVIARGADFLQDMIFVSLDRVTDDGLSS